MSCMNRTGDINKVHKLKNGTMIKLSCQIVKTNNILILKYERIHDPFSHTETYCSANQGIEQSEESKFEIEEESKHASNQYLSLPPSQGKN